MNSLALLSAKPWERYPVPDQIYMPRGMIGVEERRMLYWLTAEYYAGAGTVVDAGAYLGASAFALAAGLKQSRHAAAPYAMVHSYDRFIASDDYVRDNIAMGFFPIASDYDYFGLFEFQTALCRDKIVAHRGDFLDAPVPNAPIEILFIDVAKSGALNNRLIEHYFTRLIPGRSLVVQQDFYQAWYPYIPITMEYLSDCFTVADPFVADSSRIYRLARAIPERAIEQILKGFSAEEEAELLRRAIEKESGLTRMMLRVVEILQLVDRQHPDGARDAAIALRRDPDYQPSAYYATELANIERFRQFA